MSEAINIKVVFFAALREQLNCAELELTMAINQQASINVKQVLAQLVADQPQWQQALSSASLLMAINHEMVDENSPVTEGDEVAFFPPVTGG